jgi:hypothetical protein
MLKVRILSRRQRLEFITYLAIAVDGENVDVPAGVTSTLSCVSVILDESEFATGAETPQDAEETTSTAKSVRASGVLPVTPGSTWTKGRAASSMSVTASRASVAIGHRALPAGSTRCAIAHGDAAAA